ncbi:hypothetical protein [Xylophilus sp.]|uniref:hypothetical protein n=1 Tax=Xylophilus sp. TaxID=2653893 RepID=UPI0013B5F9E4|nr:MAG: hypothetical protein GAK38_03401 [Xylophilus sp.]
MLRAPQPTAVWLETGGACRTPAHIVRLAGAGRPVRDALLLACDAGRNMPRVGGTMVYETDAFNALCDGLGILRWQDFMFASMDCPADGAASVASADGEARQFLRRTQLSPSLAVLCGSSEVAQQAARVGADPACWRNALFADVGSSAVRGDALLGGFAGSTCAYRFGPAGHDVAHAALRDAGGGVAPLAEDSHFPLGLGFTVQPTIGLEASPKPFDSDGSVAAAVRSRGFAQAVRIEVPGWQADTNCVHLAPGVECRVRIAAPRPAA